MNKCSNAFLFPKRAYHNIVTHAKSNDERQWKAKYQQNHNEKSELTK